MKTSDFDYHLPPDLIAQHPVEPRDSSRLLVLHRETGDIEHARFHEIGRWLRVGDLLVLNDSRVIPARIRAKRVGSGGGAEFLLLERLSPGVWKAIGQPGRRLQPGARFVVEGADVEVEVRERSEDGLRVVRLSMEEGMEKWGQVPLPPYIHAPLENRERYQTVYARESGSAAAPTAGLHFTNRLLGELKGQGVRVAYVTLHVGLDTFRPVEVEDPRQHKIHTEFFQITAATAEAVNSARREGSRVVAVGTTSVRSLEQAALWSEERGESGLAATAGRARLLILPGHRFRMVDVFVTNFHLPRSTPLMLTSALAGWERLKGAYEEAIREGYRFYSFGDGMVVV
ncbi:MAG: tRNA preQ1(34) S-adenosylmethionine ribosyltransferase-isomerase QueA [SAR202 cluster bacterium]|nr:tRNA preQ1(34) S-adenosylmethionine ribosyltransferase-isomerase QueA [SAR202 cluster bacterium]